MSRPILFSLLLLWGLPGIVWADKESEAKELVEQGNELLSANKFAEAERRFALAQVLLPEASGPYAGLGFAQKGQNRCQDAVVNLKKYLEKAPSGSLSKEVKAALEECNSEEARVSIKTEPEGASITIDPPKGNSAGRSPKNVSLKPGAHTIEITKSGYETVRLELDCAPGATYSLPVVSLTKKGSEGAAPAGGSLFSLMVVPTLGFINFGGVVGFQVRSGLDYHLPLKKKDRLTLGGGLDLGVYKNGAFIEPQLSLATHTGWERGIGASELVRVGLAGDMLFFFHLNTDVDDLNAVVRDPTLGFAIRASTTVRFRLNDKYGLVVHPIAVTADPTSLQFNEFPFFNRTRLIEVFSIGYEQTW